MEEYEEDVSDSQLWAVSRQEEGESYGDDVTDSQLYRVRITPDGVASTSRLSPMEVDDGGQLEIRLECDESFQEIMKTMEKDEERKTRLRRILSVLIGSEEAAELNLDECCPDVEEEEREVVEEVKNERETLRCHVRAFLGAVLGAERAEKLELDKVRDQDLFLFHPTTFSCRYRQTGWVPEFQPQSPEGSLEMEEEEEENPMSQCDRDLLAILGPERFAEIYPMCERNRNILRMFGPERFAEILKESEEARRRDAREQSIRNDVETWCRSLEEEEEEEEGPKSKRPRLEEEDEGENEGHKMEEVPEEEFYRCMNSLWDQLASNTPEFVPLDPPAPSPSAPFSPDDDPYQPLFDELLEGQTGAGQEDYFTIETVQEKNCKKFHTTSKEYKIQVQLRPRTDAQEAVRSTVNVLERILEHVRENTQASGTDQIRLVIDGRDLDYCIQLPFMPSHELTTLRLLRHLEGIVQSKRSFFLNGEMTVLVYHVRNIQGRGVSKKKRFDTRKLQEPQAWLKTLAWRGWVVVCGGGMQEATAHYLHWREHGRPHKKDTRALQTAVQWVEQQVSPTAAEALPVLLTRLNEVTRREKGFRLVVLDWGQDDQPFFIGEGDEDEVMVLYKMEGAFHLLLHPDKIRHAEARQLLCRRCFFFFYSKTKNAHVCRDRSMSPLPAGKNNRSLRCASLNPDHLIPIKKSIVQIVDPEEGPGGGGCAFRAIATAVWLAKHPNRRARDLSLGELKERSEELCRRSGVTWGPCGPKELTVLQNVLKLEGVRLHVYYHHLKCVAFAGPWEDFAPDGPLYDIYLFHHEDHYDVIRSMTGFLERHYYCPVCEVGYNNPSDHKCHPICRCCYFPKNQCESPDVPQGRWTTCDRCHRVFKGESCFANHLQTRTHPNKKDYLRYSTCERYQKCPRCSQVIDVLKRLKASKFRHPHLRNLDEHVCGEEYCSHCKKMASRHHCHVQPVSDLKCSECDEEVTFPHRCQDGAVRTYEDQVDTRYLFFDVETMPGESVHVVNLVVAHKVCSQCMEKDDDDEDVSCDVCQDRRRVFTTRDAFCQWLFDPKHHGFTVMAHNFRGYDSYFLLEYLCARGERPSVTFRGAKLLYMELERLNLRFKDSLSFLPMPLRKFSKTFGLEDEKGHFPHFFNRPENQQYVGPYPALEEYGLSSMNARDAQELRVWHADQRGKTFDFQKELLYYCQKDVQLLKRGVLAARRIFLDTSGFDPFHDCITLASACMRSYRRNFMPENAIGIVPREGYRRKAQQSYKAKRWIWWLQSRDPHLRLQSCLTPEGEKVVVGAAVDGYDPLTGTVYQFHGCYWHGCPKCFSTTEVEFTQKFFDTQRRTAQLREAGHTVIEQWEHDWDAITPPPVTPDWLKHTDPLSPRDGLFGGRTNALQLYYEARDDETIHYVDFTSLYPSVMRQGGAYPVGHPEIILPPIDRFRILEDYYGLNKVKVLPPRDLYLPVLPIHLNGKLVFVLCRTCAEKQNQTAQCRHHCEERALVGVWTTPELQKAVELGYRILDVYEIWHYPQTSKSLFGEYVQTYLRLKQEASGWPGWCVTPEDRQRYVDDYEAHEGIRLREDHIRVNPGLRALAKLHLNSLWGKFGQNPNLPGTEYVTCPRRFGELMFGGQVEVKHLLLITEDLVQVQYETRGECTRVSSFANVVVANFVTSFARLRLYQAMEPVADRVLYFDTDSIIYVSRPGDVTLPLGDYLGDLTSEIPPGDSIQMFVSTGPKSYGYRTRRGHTEIKCKGIPLNVTSSEKVNFESMVSLVKGGETQISVHLPHQIRRDAKRRQLKTVDVDKVFQVVYDKRVRRGVGTVPYGYIDPSKRTVSH